VIVTCPAAVTPIRTNSRVRAELGPDLHAVRYLPPDDLLDGYPEVRVAVPSRL
jgi:hypothetical protein